MFIISRKRHLHSNYVLSVAFYSTNDEFKYTREQNDVDICTSFKLGFGGQQPKEGVKIEQICDGSPLCIESSHDANLTIK